MCVGLEGWRFGAKRNGGCFSEVFIYIHTYLMENVDHHLPATLAVLLVFAAKCTAVWDPDVLVCVNCLRSWRVWRTELLDTNGRKYILHIYADGKSKHAHTGDAFLVGRCSSV